MSRMMGSYCPDLWLERNARDRALDLSYSASHIPVRYKEASSLLSAVAVIVDLSSIFYLAPSSRKAMLRKLVVIQ